MDKPDFGPHRTVKVNRQQLNRCDAEMCSISPLSRLCAPFLVVGAVVGNGSSCLPHTSLIVPWPAPSCQLLPAPPLPSENQRKKMSKEQAAVVGGS